MKKRHLIIILFLLAAINSYAQKVIPLDSNLEKELVRYMEMTDPTIADDIIDYKGLYGDDPNEELIIIYDIINDYRVDKIEGSSDFGMFGFECPMVHPSWTHIFLIYGEEIVIIEDDLDDHVFNGKGNGQHLLKQIEFLVSFFSEHPDIPRSYFEICSKRLIEIYGQNRIILE